MKKTNGKTLESYEIDNMTIEGLLTCEDVAMQKKLIDVLNQLFGEKIKTKQNENGVYITAKTERFHHADGMFDVQFTRTGTRTLMAFKEITDVNGIVKVTVVVGTETYVFPTMVRVDSTDLIKKANESSWFAASCTPNVFTQVMSKAAYNTLKNAAVEQWGTLYGNYHSNYLVDESELPYGGNLDGPKQIEVSDHKDEETNEPEMQSEEETKSEVEEPAETEDDAETTEAVEVEVSAEASDDEETKSNKPYLDMTSEDFNPFRITNANLGEFLETNQDIFNKLGGKDETDIKDSLMTSFSDPAARIIMVMTLDGIAKLVRAGDLSKESVDAMLASFDNIGEGLSEMSQTNDKSNDKKKKVKVTMR